MPFLLLPVVIAIVCSSHALGFNTSLVSRKASCIGLNKVSFGITRIIRLLERDGETN